MSCEYDVLIVANSPGGWAAAVSLAGEGRKVILVDQIRSSPPGLIPRRGIFFQSFPVLERELSQEDGGFQAVMPGHRFGTSREHRYFLSELGFEFPGIKDIQPESWERINDSGQALSDYLKIRYLDPGRPSRVIWNGKLVEKLARWGRYQKFKSLRLSDLSRELSGFQPVFGLLQSPGRFCSGLHWEEEDEGGGVFSAYFQQAFFPLSSLGEGESGLWEMGEIFSALKLAAKRLKIKVVNPAPESETGSREEGGEEWGNFNFASGAKVRKGLECHAWKREKDQSPVSFRGLIWSGDGRLLMRLFPDQLGKFRGFQSLRRLIDSLEIRYVWDSLLIRMRREAIPVGMEERVFLLGDPKSDMSGENLVYLRVVPERSAGETEEREAEEIKHLRVRAFYLRPVTSSPDEVKGRVWQRICQLIPFLKEFLLEEPVVKRGDDKGTGASLVWINNRQISSKGFSHPVAQAGIFYSGPELFPALGAEADLLGGVVTAGKMEKWLGRV